MGGHHSRPSALPPRGCEDLLRLSRWWRRNGTKPSWDRLSLRLSTAYHLAGSIGHCVSLQFTLRGLHSSANR